MFNFGSVHIIRKVFAGFLLKKHAEIAGIHAHLPCHVGKRYGLVHVGMNVAPGLTNGPAAVFGFFPFLKYVFDNKLHFAADIGVKRVGGQRSFKALVLGHVLYQSMLLLLFQRVDDFHIQFGKNHHNILLFHPVLGQPVQQMGKPKKGGSVIVYIQGGQQGTLVLVDIGAGGRQTLRIIKVNLSITVVETVC